MNRRGFLLSTGAGLAAAAAGAPIVDTHIHLYDPTRKQGVPWPAKTDALLYKPTLPGDFEALVRPLGVTGTIVVEASGWVEDNQWVLDLAKENRMIVGHVGHLEPGIGAFRQQLARFVRNPIFRGIRLNAGAITAGVARPEFVDDLKRLAGEGLMLDAIGSATMLRALITLTEKIPSLRIAIDHMPSEPPGWVERRAELRELAKSPRVYAKVSGVIGAPRELLDEVWGMFGEERVMYGSNWPVSNKVAPYAEVLKTMQRYTTSEKYFWRNSKECYRWVARG